MPAMKICKTIMIYTITNCVLTMYTYTNCRYRVMLQCWEIDPDQRPTFTALVDLLSRNLEVMADYMDLQNSVGKHFSTNEITSNEEIANAEEQEIGHSTIVLENAAVADLYDSEGTNSDESQL